MLMLSPLQCLIVRDINLRLLLDFVRLGRRGLSLVKNSAVFQAGEYDS
jgi:hypothetical protein